MPSNRSEYFVKVCVVALCLTAPLMLAACGGPGGSSKDAIIPSSQATEVVAGAVATSLETLVTPGVLTVAIFNQSPPSAYLSPDGRLIGWEVDLAKEIARRLGIEVKFEEVAFPSVLDGVEGGAADIGIASMFDTPVRQQRVDFIDYYTGGTNWITSRDSAFDAEVPCGSRVGAVSGSAQLNDFLPRISQACIADGQAPLEVIGFESPADATAEIIGGRLDAAVADGPVASFAVGASFGRLASVGNAVEIQPYGIAVGQENETLQTAILSVLNSMVADGSYLDLLGRWGVEDGYVSEFTRNGV
ncbi:MAG: transporter substrate-binding domain-containing protein [Actinobacteria bacterium]|nr:transporter substrate-binding domain-containing protein [Actinomycetota bacterium]